MRLDHPIFRGPLAVAIETAPIKTPDGYRSYLGGKELPERLPAWTVQSGELGKSVDYGLVSDPFGFEDTPDAEWISGGVNSKGPDSVALGRQGNWFLWGFAGDPTQMTASARRVFLNAVVWMDQFDGRAPLHTRTRGAAPTTSRDQALNYCCLLEEYGDNAEMRGYFTSRFPQRVIDEVGPDPKALLSWYRENLEFVLPTPGKHVIQGQTIDTEIFEVDALLEGFGVGNRGLELFELLGELIADRGPEDETVVELFDRYLPEDAPRAAEALARWVEERRGRLYFSDTAGYRWFVAPEGLPPRATAPARTAPAAPAGADVAR
jgi:hypothetical protein